jgi:hypothetical protein
MSIMGCARLSGIWRNHSLRVWQMIIFVVMECFDIISALLGSDI